MQILPPQPVATSALIWRPTVASRSVPPTSCFHWTMAARHAAEGPEGVGLKTLGASQP